MTEPSELRSTKDLLTEQESHYLRRIKDKQTTPGFEIAFCGHFSAGKSTLLNTLMGEELLPVSPIPTSANVIQIKNGQTGLKAFLNGSEEEIIFDQEIPWNKVREWGKNGADIHHLEVTFPLPFINSYSSILDTPGVDSTDPEHQSVTVDQLFTTDLVVYVMDYNHVQSETNLRFLKQLTNERKPLIIVINQIDKHVEDEVSLETFRASIKKTMYSWKIRFQDLFFTSMKETDHPFNEWSTFSSHIKALLHHSDELIETSSGRLEIGFYENVKSRIEHELHYVREEFEDDLKQVDLTLDDFEKYLHIKKELNELVNFEDGLFETYQSKQDYLFKNIVLFPHKLTELTREWLEISTSKPKGFLFGRKKLEKKRHDRMTLLIDELNDQIKSVLSFHVRLFLKEDLPLEHLSSKEDYLNKMEDDPIEITEDFLESFRKKGPVSRDYVYQYTDQVTKRVIQIWKEHTEKTLLYLADSSKISIEQKIQELEQAINQENEMIIISEQIKKRSEVLETQLSIIEQKLKALKIPTDYYRLIDDIRTREISVNDSFERLTIVQPEEDTDKNETNNCDTHDVVQPVNETDISHLLQLADLTSAFADVPLLKEERERFLQQAHKLKNQDYVISLFGAFSAGKSSFANALTGADLLPVSPQPATASRTTITKPTESYDHGTILVQFKEIEEIESEMEEISQILGVSLTIDALSKWGPAELDRFGHISKSAVDYIDALRQGFEEMKNFTGRRITTTVDDLYTYAAKESVSSMVDHITVYFDSELTRQGITLVDTPGVNSIHTRHTKTAFRQINRSDAIFFLTYYNHAFSKADQYFIEQLGEVNASSSMDKLYFIINASDLALNQTELESVKEHVRSELVRTGNKHASVSSLSSKEGLRAKLNQTEDHHGFSDFEAYFRNRMMNQLKRLSYDQAVYFYNQYQAKGEEWLRLYEAPAQQREAYIGELEETCSQALDWLSKQSFHEVYSTALQELDERIIHFRKRVTYVMTDYFTEYLNVSVLTADQRKELRNQSDQAIRKWLSTVEQYMNRGGHALLANLDNHIQHLIRNWHSKQIKGLQDFLPYLYPETPDRKPFDDEFQFSFKHSVDIDFFISSIKSKRSLFVEQEIKELKEGIISSFEEDVIRYLKDWQKHANEHLKSVLTSIKTEFTEVAEKSVLREKETADLIQNEEVMERLRREIRGGSCYKGDDQDDNKRTES